MSFYFTLDNGETTCFPSANSKIVDVYTVNKVYLAEDELAQFNRLMKDKKTRRIFWKIFTMIDGTPEYAFIQALQIPFRIYPNGSDEKYCLAAKIFKNKYPNLEEGRARNFDPDKFLKDELESDSDFFWVDNDLVKIL